MEHLRNPVRPYAWGSRTAIAELLGHEVPARHPEAELWMGAHPGDPSVLAGSGQSLLDALIADPAGQLGDQADRWGGRLPFLLKVLAAEEPLSLQAHPSAEQARAGYEREEAAGVPRDAATRSYPDPTPKPELVCALTEFHALAGFRAVADSVRLLEALDVPPLRPYIDLLAGQPDRDGLRALFTTWITLPQPALDELLPHVLDGCVLHVKERGEFDLECRTILELGETYPGDAGVLAALLVNRIVLAPGEALYLPAGNLHAYLRGTAVEILANSDNVLRGGLTPKHVDVPELLRVLDFAGGRMPVVRPVPVSPHLAVYGTTAAEFELSRLEWAGDTAAVDLPPGPQILFCAAGSAVLTSAGGELTLARGEAAWVPAAEGAVTARSAADRTLLFRATAGQAAR